MTIQAGSIIKKERITIALAGQPNTGKSTVFNQLTGAAQHVGNWPGKTVEQKSGHYSHNGVQYHVIDLPGTYSLTANSLEETISRDFILKNKPDVVIVLVDASQLQRTMYLLADMLPMKIPIIVALNMMDVAEQHGRKIDVKMLEQKIGIPIVSMVATKKQDISELIKKVHHYVQQENPTGVCLPGLSEADEILSGRLQTILTGSIPSHYPVEWVALKLLEGDTGIIEMVRDHIPEQKWKKLEELLVQSDERVLSIASERFSWIQQVSADAVTSVSSRAAKITRSKFDQLATHPIWGVPIAIIITLAAFMAAIIIALPVMQATLVGIAPIVEGVREVMATAPHWLGAMLADGLLPGVSMALAFLGFMMGMFVVIGFLEDVGYMARVAFVADGFMTRIGLHGKSFMPMFSSLGCNIAGVLGSRVVDSWQQRMMTMVMAPIVPCLAVWTVTGFFGTLFFGSGVALITIILFLTLFLWLTFTGFLFKKILVKGEPGGMIMELPPYHKPNWRTIWRFTWLHTKSFLLRGFTLIAAASLVIWALSYLPNGEIDSSFLASIGRVLEPVGHLVGLNWQLVVALLAASLSKEAALATLGVLYGISSGSGDTSLTGLMLSGGVLEESSIGLVLRSAISPASALSFIFAVFYSVPCLGTVGAIFSETKSVKWTVAATSYYVFATLLAGFLAYRVGLLIF